MVVKSASMKRLLDVGVSEKVARRLADGRKWDDVVNLTFYEWLTIGTPNQAARPTHPTQAAERILYNKVQDIGSKESNTASARAALNRFSQWLVTAKYGNYLDEADFGLMVDDLNVWKKGGPKESPATLGLPRAGFDIIPERSDEDEEKPHAFLHGNKVHLGVWRAKQPNNQPSGKTFYERNGRYIPYFELDTWYYIDFASETEPMPEFDYQGHGRWPKSFTGEGTKHHYLVRWRKSHFNNSNPVIPYTQLDQSGGTIQPWKGELQQISLAADIGTPWDNELGGLDLESGGVEIDTFGWSSEPILIHKIPNTPKFLGVINYPFTSMD
jgi:hypothetical protein